MTMMVADTVIAGRYGTADLAGVAIGSSYYISVVMLLTPACRRSRRRSHTTSAPGRQEAIAPALQQGFWLALLLAGPIALLLNGLLLRGGGVPPAVAAKAADYLAATAFRSAAHCFLPRPAPSTTVRRPRVLMAARSPCLFCPARLGARNGALRLRAPMGGTGCGVSTATVTLDPCRLGFIPGFATMAGAPRPGRSANCCGSGLPMGCRSSTSAPSPDRHPRRPPRHRDVVGFRDHRQLHRHDLHAAAVTVDRHHGAGGAVRRQRRTGAALTTRGGDEQPRSASRCWWVRCCGCCAGRWWRSRHP